MKNIFLALVAFALLPASLLTAQTASQPTIPVDQIHTGMRGVAYTVFQGIKPESMDVEVLGILHNVNGPQQRRNPGPSAWAKSGIHGRGCGNERQPRLLRRQAGGRDRVSHR